MGQHFYVVGHTNDRVDLLLDDANVPDPQTSFGEVRVLKPDRAGFICRLYHLLVVSVILEILEKNM